MQELIYESKFEKIYFNAEQREAYQVWFDTTTEINDDLVRSEQEKMAELYEEYKPLYHLADSRKFAYPISPELQSWISTVIAKRVQDAGVKKSAMVMPEEFIVGLSVDQLGDEISKDISTRDGKKTPEDELFQVRVFATVEEARKWFYGE